MKKLNDKHRRALAPRDANCRRQTASKGDPRGAFATWGKRSWQDPSGIAVFILLSSIFTFCFCNNTFAENFDTNVAIKPSLTLDISSDKISMSLDPASKTYDEKDLVVSVGTNNSYGYKLYVSSGNIDTSGNITTNLINIADNTKTIPNITSTYPLSSMPVNSWGYRLTNNSTISTGDYGVFTSGSIVSESDTPVNNNISTLGFASKIDYTMPSGTYELTLNFKALPIVTQYYMQDLSDSTLAAKVCTEDPTIVIDKRDEKAYTIRRINGTCWMIDNLRFTGEPDDPDGKMTLRPATTNIDAEKIIIYGNFSDGSSWSEARIDTGTILKEDTSRDVSENTVWYNYAAASADTITANVDTGEAIYSLCPFGWNLPSVSEQEKILNHITEFNPVYGGYYNSVDGHLSSKFGSWWSSTATSVVGLRWVLGYSGGKLIVNNKVDSAMSERYIRCTLNGA